MMNSSDTVICTVATRSHLAKVRVLARSVREHHPDIPFVLLLVDRERGDLPVMDDITETLLPAELDIPGFRDMAFRYNQLELCASLKAFLMAHLLKKRRNVFLLDADILLCAPLTTAIRSLDEHTIILTPHTLSPVENAGGFNDITSLQCGLYNAGFIAVRQSDEADGFLTWWKERMKTSCYIRPEEGLFAEQRWLDLVPQLFGKVLVFKYPEYNVAYWNIHERSITCADSRWLVNGRPLVFFHFSGFDPLMPLQPSIHAAHLRLAGRADVRMLFDVYREKLLEAGYAESSKAPYAYGQMSDGTVITQRMRILFANNHDEFPGSDPFDAQADRSFLAWYRALDDRNPSTAATGLHTFLLHRHTWEPYQRFTRSIRKMIGAETFAKLRSVARSVDIAAQRRALHRVITAKHKDVPAGPKGVNLVCHAASESGLGEAGRSTIRSLEASGIPFAVLNQEHPGIRTDDTTYAALYSHDNPFALTILQINPDQLWRHVRAHGTAWLRDKYIIGYWAWELPELPGNWTDAFGLYDEIWTLSDYMHGAIKPHTRKPVLTMPLNLSVADAHIHDRASFGIPGDRFVFLYVFDFHSTMERKNPLEFAEAFREAFRHDDKAMIIIKTANGDAYPEKKRRLEKALEGLPYRLFDGYMSHAELHDLIGICDVYVSLHRSEGYGLTIAEAMWLGKPVIATDYGGNRDFLHASHGYPVPFSMTTVMEDSHPYKKGSSWAQPDIAVASAIMRRLYEHPDEGRATGEKAKIWAHEYLSAAATAGKMKERIDEISLKLGLK